MPTESMCCSTLSLDIHCSSRIPGRKGTRWGGKGWARGPHYSFGLNPSTSYDEDFNHEPCRRKGHKAHWAVSTGGSPPVSLCLHPGSPQLPCCPCSHFHPCIGTSPLFEAGTWQAAGASVSTSWGFQKQTQCADFWIKHSGLQVQSCHFQALTLGFHMPIWKSR